ncbi:hypothetical protein DL764_008872 [Monosporascus ibericus]|uniref:Uncharacterized protein n=1 Tax=Monosporascus ibericus TaxID=155417 RepID=A0A4Q4SZ68_9PEZI|nr:hypothetical protein DL764_008872 [Monosporascus ibericus]
MPAPQPLHHDPCATLSFLNHPGPQHSAVRQLGNGLGGDEPHWIGFLPFPSPSSSPSPSSRSVNNIPFRNCLRKPLTARSIEDAMFDTIPPRSHVDRNIASEKEDPALYDLSSNEHDFFGKPSFMESAADQHFDRVDARNERSESHKGLDDLMRQYTAPPQIKYQRRRPSIPKRYKTRANCLGRLAVHETTSTADRVQSWATVVRAFALRKAMVSSLLGGFPLKVDAIPDDNGFIPDGKGSQITNHSHARLGGTYGLNCNNSSDFLLDAGPASMDTGFSTVDVPDQQTVDPLWIQAGNWDGTGVSIQLENPELLRDTGFYLTEPLNDASSTAYDLDATGFACDEGSPVCTYPNTVGPECYGDDEISQSVPTPRL